MTNAPDEKIQSACGIASECDWNDVRLPRYSIVMAVYNAETTLAKAIESVLSQTFGDWELIAVNDGSEDRSRELLESFVSKDSRVRMYEQPNMGPGAARKLGIEKCRGDFVAFLDSDDYWEADFLGTVSQFDDDVLFIERLYEREDGSLVGCSHVSSNLGASNDQIVRRQMTGLIPWGMGKVFRRSLLEKSRAGFSELEVGEEAVFSFEVVSAARSIGFVDKPIYHYVKRGDGQHKKGGRDPWAAVVKTMSEHLKGIGEFERYETTINSFALRSLCIAVYRISCEEDTSSQAARMIASCFEGYERGFDFARLDRDSLDRVSFWILALLRFRLYGVIVALSKARKSYLSY